MLKKKKKYNVAVVGATGAVGGQMISILEERKFPVDRIRLLASARVPGRKLSFAGREAPVEVLGEDSFHGIDIALFSAGGGRSKQYAPIAAKEAVVVDNTSYFRMYPDVPLVVPEVNPEDIAWHKGIIANPNCSTIQMVVALKPIHDAARIKRIVVTTFQSVSGAGARAVDEMYKETRALLDGGSYQRSIFPHQIAFNCIPQIPQSAAFLENGYTQEEMKMTNETRKMFHDDSIMVSATCVRVPVDTGHSEAINIETERKITAAEVRKLLSTAEGVKVVDDVAAQQYPLAIHAAGRDETFVGRIREDISCPNGIAMWVVSDNLRKGAALNAIQIAERLIAML
ncbi:MAG: aspartate-semialdehyde dehydrogenase [bacterium]|nr:aspartate-semialdehyde dehydrogenase [bacterium]